MILYYWELRYDLCREQTKVGNCTKIQQIIAIVQSSLIFYACSRGFGTSIVLLDDSRLNQIQAVSWLSSGGLWKLNS